MHVVPSIPVGLGYIAEALSREGIEAEVFDMAFMDQGLKGYDTPDLLKKIKDDRPDLIGFSLMTLRHKAHYAVITKVKEKFPEITIVAGGPHLSTMRGQVLEECESIDYGFVLEADLSFPLFCKGERAENIKGLLYRSNGEVVYNGDPDFIKDLDTVPFPRYAKFEMNKYPEQTVYLATSRGCPHQCIYCPVKVSIGRQFRFYGAERLAEEIGYWYGRGFRNFVMWDDNFTYIKKRVMDFCAEIEKRNLHGCNFTIPNGIRADRIDRATLQRMKQIGFSHVSIGVESGSNKVLQTLKKGETAEQIDQAIKDATELGYAVYLYFILGSPGETIADAQKSFDLALKYPVDEARFYKLIPFPNTELFDWVREHNLFIRLPDEYLNDADHFSEEPCFTTPELGYQDRVNLYRKGLRVARQVRLKRRMRQFKNMGLVGTWFARLLESDFFIGLFDRFPKLRVVLAKSYALVAGK